MLLLLPAAPPRRADARTLEPVQAAALAQALIEQARREGDVRLLGQAEGLLQPWRHDDDANTEILLLRATLQQARHEFTAALRDLDLLLARAPAHAQALLTRATVLRVQGRLGEAARDCAHLLERAPGFAAQLCVASVQALRGDKAAAAALEALAPEVRRQAPPLRAWYAAERAELAARAGDAPRALALLVGALATGLDDPLLRAAAADLLLAQGRAAEALRLAGEQPASDVLRLRAALAARALGRPRADLEITLADAYAAAARRGTGAHLREEARFALEIRGDAPRALALAQRNWQDQREPEDARLLLAAAAAAGQPAAAEQVRRYLREHGLQDARFAPALAGDGGS